MARSVRPVGAAIAAASALFLATFSSTAVLNGHAQGATPPTVAQAAPFAGDWVVTVAMGGNQQTSLVSVKTDAGKVTATVTPEGQAPITSTKVTMAGKNLAVSYSIDMQGTAISSVLTLTPQADAGVMRAQVAIMDGQYEMAGMAAKQAPGAPFPGPQRGGSGRGRRFRWRRPPDDQREYRLHAEDADQGEDAGRRSRRVHPAARLPHGTGRVRSRRHQPRRHRVRRQRPDVRRRARQLHDGRRARPGEHDPISRISRWESTKGDGVYDKHTVFADKLVAPRMILPLDDGVILTSETDSDDIIKLTDTNGDGVADKREVVFTGDRAERRRQHRAPEGRLRCGTSTTGSTRPTTRSAFRWTPNGFLREPTGPNGGQWGLTHGRRRQAVVRRRGRRARADELPVPDPLRRVHAVSVHRWPHYRRPRGRPPRAAEQPDLSARNGKRFREGLRRRLAGAGHRRHAGRHRPHPHARRRTSITSPRPRVRRSSAATGCRPTARATCSSPSRSAA